MPRKNSSATLAVDPVEEQFNAAISRAEHVIRDRWHKLEESVRRSPTTSILIAVGIGHCLHRLPLRSILATQLKILWALAPPTLLAVGAGKLYQALEGGLSQVAEDRRSRAGGASKTHSEARAAVSTAKG